MVLFSFSIFFATFLEFPLTRCVGTERNDSLYFLFLGLLQLILAGNEAMMVLFTFSNFFAIFLEFLITRCVGTERNDNF